MGRVLDLNKITNTSVKSHIYRSGLYNIYGYVVFVEGPLDAIFSKEYKYFRIPDVPRKIDLFVRIHGGDLPARAPEYIRDRILSGRYMPFAEGENTLWYDQGADCGSLIYYCEGLMWWPDKTRLHAGAVAKDGRAFVFTGGGGIGKTSCVLNLVGNGYDYLSDDWLIVGGNTAFPLPKRIHIFGYNLRDKEIAKRSLGWRQFTYRLRCQLSESGSRFKSRYLRYAFWLLRPQTLTIELQKLYPESLVASPSNISKIFYLQRRKIDKIKIKDDINAKELARRMAYVSIYEWSFIFREYCKYVYRFGTRNRRMENRFHHDLKLMHETFKTAELRRVILPENLDLTKIDLLSRYSI